MIEFYSIKAGNWSVHLLYLIYFLLDDMAAPIDQTREIFSILASHTQKRLSPNGVELSAVIWKEL